MTTLVSAGLPIGAILPFGGPISNIPAGFLPCNGALINRNDFADLFAVIGTQWGTSGPTDFRVPTTNGNQLRGRASGSGSDPDRNSRTAVQTGGATGDNVGSLQTWRVQSHRHVVGPFAQAAEINSGVSAIDFMSGSYVNGEVSNNFTNNAGPITNKGALGINEVTNSAGFGTGMGGFNGNFNTNDNSPNTVAERFSRKFRMYTANTGGNQTVGRNVYVEFIIKF